MAKAAEYWTIAAEAGNRDAMERLARCYLRGDGVETNPDEATRWLVRAGVIDDKPNGVRERAFILDSEGKALILNFIDSE